MVEIIVNAGAWKGSDIVNNPRWQFFLEEADIEEIDAALQQCKNLKLNQRSIRADQFSLNIVKSKFAQIAS